MFQRAYLTAQSMGVADKAHDAHVRRHLDHAVSSASPIPSRTASSPQLPSIEDIASFYQRVTGVKPADFVAASKSFGVDLKMRQADSQIIAMQVSSTPTLVVNGKYRVNNDNLTTDDMHRAGEVPGRQGKRARSQPRRRPRRAPAPAKKP